MPKSTATFPVSAFSLRDARLTLHDARCCVITDGKMGDLAQCLGVVERLGLSPDIRTVKPRAPFTWLMPWGPVDPRESAGKPGSPIAAPFPDIAIASGRRAVPYLRAIKAASSGKTFTVFLKDPRIGPKAADFIWAPAHDSIRGANVLTTLTSPHRLSEEAIALARSAPTPWVQDRSKITTALLLGGPSKDFRFTPQDCARFIALMDQAMASGAQIVATPSRRTPVDLANAVARKIRAAGGYFWDGNGENPYRAILAHAQALIGTAESVNMIGEAASTGKGIYVFRPSGQSQKIDQFLRGLDELGATRPFQGRIEAFSYSPVDSTPLIAIELARRFLEHRK